MGDSVRKALHKALHPHPALIAALVAASAALLVWCFAYGGRGTPLSYVAYLLSTYALAVAAIGLVPVFRRLPETVKRLPGVSRLVGDEGLRVALSAAWSILFDLAYAGFTLATGLIYDSGWAIAVALYYVVLAGVGFATVWELKRISKLPEQDVRAREEHMARACGIVMLLLALALSGVMVQMVVHRQAWVYSDIVVIGQAASVFVSFAMTIRSVAKIRQLDSLALSVSRAVGMSKALVQMFFLETTMVATFGGGEGFRFVVEAVTGGIVFLGVIAIATGLIYVGVRRI